MIKGMEVLSAVFICGALLGLQVRCVGCKGFDSRFSQRQLFLPIWIFQLSHLNHDLQHMGAAFNSGKRSLHHDSMVSLTMAETSIRLRQSQARTRQLRK
jgi:hypothetical protein